MNPTIDNDLQKAIDDITNSTNSDPVFGDAVASPEPIAPTPHPTIPTAPKAPRPMVGGPAPRQIAPRPMAPRPSAPIAPMAPRPVAPSPRPVMPAPRPVSTPKPIAPTPTSEPIAPAPVPPVPEMPSMPEPSNMPTPESSTFSEESIVSMDTVSTPESTTPSDIRSVKEAALRDLAPILSKVDMDSTKKFNLYKNIREELHDNSVIAPAYETAKDIEDDKTRADALLYLIDSIDNM